MSRQSGCLFFLLSALASCCFGQSIAGAGYSNPQVTVSPGQVITLFVSGFSTIFPAGASRHLATQLPLPVSLAGFSATLSQSSTGRTWQLPLFQVDQVNNCSPLGATQRDCVITELTVHPSVLSSMSAP